MSNNKLHIHANCMTTAMGIMPHTNVETALKLAMSLDIPYWPQLPNVSYYEDMYAQTSEHFPGISINTEEAKIRFNTRAFAGEIDSYSRKMAMSDTFSLSQEYSRVYHRFLDKDLSAYPAIRGQVTGPVSFGFRVTDENSRPLIYNKEARALLFDFIQRKVTTQYHELKKKNENAFVWVDEPGLGWVFSGLSGYNDLQAKEDYRLFWEGLDGPGGLHLCANINLSYLLEMGADILSFDAYQIELLPKGYASAVADYLIKGGIISWGIVPTDSDNLSQHTPETLEKLILGYWKSVSDNAGIPVHKIAEQSLLAPARCCLKNIGKVGASTDTSGAGTEQTGSSPLEEQLVEQAFVYLKSLSDALRNRFSLESGR
ncbi:hypothetical protein ACFLXC_03345 [Chloroflexota bacterium]